jgi:hypothetical protein
MDPNGVPTLLDALDDAEARLLERFETASDNWLTEPSTVRDGLD